jgi:hypothetical protein
MKDTSGQKCSESSKSSSLQSVLESRLQVNLDGRGSPLYVLTWRQQAMPSGPPICVQQARARRISVEGITGELCGWATPTATDSKRGVLPSRPQDTGVPLTQQVGNSVQDKTFVFLRGTTPTGYSIEPIAGDQLNPEHSRWLMGYPAGWYSSTDTETPSCPS